MQEKIENLKIPLNLYWYVLRNSVFTKVFSSKLCIPVSSNNKTDRHDITEILLIVA